MTERTYTIHRYSIMGELCAEAGYVPLDNESALLNIPAWIEHLYWGYRGDHDLNNYNPMEIIKLIRLGPDHPEVKALIALRLLGGGLR